MEDKKNWDRECPKNKLTGEWFYWDKNGKPNQIKINPPENPAKNKKEKH